MTDKRTSTQKKTPSIWKHRVPGKPLGGLIIAIGFDSFDTYNFFEYFH